MTERDTRLLDVMIIGAEKAGTTSLANYLGSHPEVCTHAKREMTYFLSEEEYSQGFADVYYRYFSECKNSTKKILGKSVGICTQEQALKRVYDHNPNVKIIFVMRDPIDRAYSAFWYAKRRGWEDAENFETAIDRELSQGSQGEEWSAQRLYLKKGKYAEQIVNIQRYFDGDRLHIYSFEDFMKSPQEICADIFRKIGVNDEYKIDARKRFNQSARARSATLARAISYRGRLKKYLKHIIPRRYADMIKRQLMNWNEVPFSKPEMNEITKKKLEEYYRADSSKLANLLNGKMYGSDFCNSKDS